MTNPLGWLHGGIIACIMDDFIGATLFAVGRTNLVRLEKRG